MLLRLVYKRPRSHMRPPPTISRSCVARLVKTEMTAARQMDARRQAPARRHDLSAYDVVLAEPGHFRMQVIAQEIDLMLAVVSRMAGDLGRRRSEDQPAGAGIDRGKFQHVAEEGA